MMKSTFAIAAIVSLNVGCTSAEPAPVKTADDTGQEAPSGAEATADIVDTAVAAGSFETLVAAVKAADLVDTLKGEGPFTVFAPTDEAFAKLPAGTVDDLLKPENKDKLKAVLTYHVVSGKVTAAQVSGMTEAVTVQGDAVSIQAADGTVKVGPATVVKADIQCTNGIIHVIDTVLIPE